MHDDTKQPPRISAGQLFKMTGQLLRETHLEIAALEMGPYDAPLTPEQREGIDRFIADAIDRAIPLVHIRSDEKEHAVAFVRNQWVS